MRLGCRQSSPAVPEGTCEVSLGEPVTLECDAVGARPAAALTWQRDGRDIQPSKSYCVAKIIMKNV